MNNSFSGYYLRKAGSLFGAGLSLFAANAVLAQPAAPAEESVKLEKFVVTGSLLPKTEGETFIPLSTYSAMTLLRLGASTPIEGLRSLPSFFGAATTELDSNGGDGSASVNLRGLGGTLTLVNGRRAYGFADLNLIPIDAIQSIDILKDGAGSVYGADALAGVVNVVLKKKWIGSQLRANYGISGQGDAQQWDTSFVFGQTFDKNKGYITLVGSYSDKDTLYARDRKLSANADGRPMGGQNGGSPTFPGHIGSAGAGLLLNSSLQFGTSPADYGPFVPSTDGFNFRLFSPSIPGQTRKLAHLAAGYELYGNQVEPYVEYDYGDQYTANGLAPAPFAINSAIGRNSIYNPWGKGVTVPGNTLRYRGTDTGNRLTQYAKKDYRVVLGVKGSFANGWGYDSAYMMSHEDQVLTEANGVFNSKILAEVAAGRFNPFARAGTTGTFRGSTWNNHTSLESSLASGQKPSEDTLETYDFKMFGPAMELPSGPANLAIGYETRKTRSTYNPDPVYFAGDLLGYNSGNKFDASSSNNAFYGEVSIPVFSEKNNADMGFVRELSITGNLRYDNASVRDNITGDHRSFGSDTMRVGLRWQPTDDLVLRASYGTGFRVPGLGALYAAPGNNFPTLIDPLRFPIGQQTDVATKGNPDLDPSTSVSKGVGFIYSPKNAPGLNITVDYYQTALLGLISDGAQFILNQNAATQGAGFPIVTKNAGGVITSVVTNPSALYAKRIFRDPTSGQLDDQTGSAIDSTNLNVSERAATGIDYSISYRQPSASWGQLTHTLEFNQVLSWEVVPEVGSAPRDYLGQFVDPSSDAIAPGSIPEWKGYYNLLWQKDSWTVSFTVNYIHSVLDDPNAQYTNAAGHFAYLDKATGRDVETDDITMERYVTFDLTATYAFKSDNSQPAPDDLLGHALAAFPAKWFKGTEIRFTVQNIGDEPPPFSAGAFNDNYDTSMYNTRGRFYQFGIVRKF
ncbi:MAG: TonB-dependent receptor [Lacunisphaera sp.]|nr:TonB-dependent receptor [Lacunisphaera sp.]